MERAGDGNVRFRRPDGRLLPESPPLPPLEGDPVQELREADGAHGAEIDEWTVTPDWDGEPFDFDIALGYFLFQGPEDGGGDEGGGADHGGNAEEGGCDDPEQDADEGPAAR